MGFESPTIPTSQFYCDTMPWPLNDERTWEVTGVVKVISRPVRTSCGGESERAAVPAAGETRG